MANKHIKHKKCSTSLACHSTVVVEGCRTGRNVHFAGERKDQFGKISKS